MTSLLLAGLLGTAAQGSTQYSSLETKFVEAERQHDQDYRNLLSEKTSGIDISFPTHEIKPSKEIGVYLHQNFGDKSAILFYILDESHLVVWLLDHQGIKVRQPTSFGLANIDHAVSEFRSAIGVDALQVNRAPRSIVQAPAQHPENPTVPVDQAIKNLSQMLLPGKIASALQGYDEVMVVPLGNLGAVPFSVLEPKLGHPLIEDATVTLLPSLFDLNPPQDWTTVSFKNALVVANPSPPVGTEWTFPALPGAQGEGEAIAALLDVKPLTQAQATVPAVEQRAAISDLLYFAAHAYGSSSDSRRRSFIALAPSPNSSGLWLMENIMHHRYAAKLAVLSACQTGLGQPMDGGEMALGRTFQVMGVLEVVTSLWNVSDESTSALMTCFMTKLVREHLSPADALREAMLTARRDFPSLANWGAFVLFGNPR